MRSAIILASLIMVTTRAAATEKAVLVPSTVIVNGLAAGLHQGDKTDRTLQNSLQGRSYTVEKAHERGDIDSTAFLAELLSKHHAALVVSVRIDGARDDEVENDWSVAVRVLRRGDQEPSSTKEQCDACVFGTAVQARVVAALDRALSTPAPGVAAATSTEHSEVATATTRPAESNPPPSEPEKSPPQPPVLFPPPPSSPHATQERAGLSPAALGVLAVATSLIGAGGVAVLAIGGKVLADDGKPTCSSGGPSQCPTLFDTKTQGGAMVAVGAVAVVGAAIGLIFEVKALAKAKRTQRYSIAPTFGPSAVGVSLGGGW